MTISNFMKKSGKYIARLTYNGNGWQSPSCKDGKCKSTGKKPLYEETAGFGWEEWLFCPENRIEENGIIYQYGFLQCFNNNAFNEEITYGQVYLHTRKCDAKNSTKGVFYVVAKIENLIRLSKKDADFINQTFQENGNFARMRNDDCVKKGHFDAGPKPGPYKINTKFKVDEVWIVTPQTEIKPINYWFKIVELIEKKPKHKELLDVLEKKTTYTKLK